LLLLACVFAGATSCAPTIAQEVPAYKDPKLSIEQRVADLLVRMTLEEKLAQIESAWGNRAFVREAQPFLADEKGAFLPERAQITLKNGLGQVSRPSENPGGSVGRANGELTNAIQKWVKENTAAGNSSHVPRRVFARARGVEGYGISGGDLVSRRRGTKR